jgi:hypothetical protein
MIRVGLALAIIGLIFIQSPVRSSKSLGPAPLARAGQAPGGLHPGVSVLGSAALLMRLQVQAARDTGTR